MRTTKEEIDKRLVTAWVKGNNHLETPPTPELLQLMESHGIRAIFSPRELQAELVQNLPQAKKIRIAGLSPLHLFLCNLKRAYTPDTWEELEKMEAFSSSRFSKGIRVVRPPIGTPPEIARSWVGRILPFGESSITPLIFTTPELQAIGFQSNDGMGYCINSAQAVQSLEQQDRLAATAYKTFRHHWENPSDEMIFDSRSCQVVEVLR